jgi:hypothetical protein
MIYDGEESAFTQELRDRGVEVIFHRSTLYGAFQNHRPGDDDYLRIASGAFLRFDIPLIETSEEFVIYTDCDVIFRAAPNFFTASRPDYFSATSQFEKNADRDMNSGVMLINVPAMRSINPDLVEFTLKNLNVGLDQEILRIFFESRYTAMDMSLNWKPYWGVNLAAQIVHFHGPKPSRVDGLNEETVSRWTAGWRDLYARSPEGYAEYFKLWSGFLDSYNRELVGCADLDLQQSLEEDLRQMAAERDHWRSAAERAQIIATEPTVRSASRQKKSGFASFFKR